MHDLPKDAEAALQRGDKILAIKLTREALGLDLKSAKELVDARAERDPMLRERLREQNAKLLRTLVTVLAAAAAGYWLFLRP